MRELGYDGGIVTSRGYQGFEALAKTSSSSGHDGGRHPVVYVRTIPASLVWRNSKSRRPFTGILHRARVLIAPFRVDSLARGSARSILVGSVMTAVETAGKGIVAADVRPAHGVLGRTRGLMFRGQLADGEALDIRPCGSIHMMFMRFPIDAVFYNQEHRVTRVARNLRPWIGLAFGGKGARGVIEMRAGTAASVAPGDLLEFRELKQGSS